MVPEKRASRRVVARIGQIFVYYDGPQVLTLIDNNNRTWIATALPSDEKFEYPVFCVQVPKVQLSRYLRGHVDLRYLFRFCPQSEYRVADLAPMEGQEITLRPAKPNSDWFPEEGFFATDHTEPGANEIKSHQPTMTVKIDGKWEFPEFAAFSGRMSDCYSFLYMMSAAEIGEVDHDDEDVSDVPSIDLPIEDYPWKRGGSSRSFYRAAYSRVPANDRLNVQRIAYNSPGTIDLGGNPEIIAKIVSNLNSMEEHFHTAREEYAALHTFLSHQKLLGAPADTARGDLKTQEIVSDRVRTLADLISFEGVEALYAQSHDNWIRTAKIIMSYYRRLRDLFQFYAEGRASLSDLSDDKGASILPIRRPAV
jgi:hypothetical protein